MIIDPTGKIRSPLWDKFIEENSLVYDANYNIETDMFYIMILDPKSRQTYKWGGYMSELESDLCNPIEYIIECISAGLQRLKEDGKWKN